MNKDVKERVKELLVTSPYMRDYDNALIGEIWYFESGQNDKLLFTEFLEDFEDGKYTSAETIRRTRQLLQADNESLRGEKYKERQRKGEEVRQTINNG